MSPQVLLSLSDSNVISLSGQPTWFTVCPLDPNLPALPKPVHYKQHRQHLRMEHLLSKFVHKAQAFAHLTTGTMKPSVSLSSGFADLGTVERAKSGSATIKHIRKTKQEKYDPQFLQMLYSNGDLPPNRHTINEAKLAKLNSIISVLRGSADSSDGGEGGGGKGGGSSGGELTPPLPEFTNIFKTDKQLVENEPENRGSPQGSRQRQRKRNKLPRTVLHALREDLADSEHSSDSSDYHDDDSSPSNSLNEQSTAWLAMQKRNGTGRINWVRPQSDSFYIPRMKESLNAGRRNKVSNYTFDSPLEVQRVAERTNEIESDEMEENEEGRQQQMHYKLLHIKSLPEEEEEERMKDSSLSRPFSMPADFSSSMKASSPYHRKSYPVPVEVSVHHICVVDVDKEKEELEKLDLIRSRSMNTRSPAMGQEGTSVGGAMTMGERIPIKFEKTEYDSDDSSKIWLRRPSPRTKPRALSLGDMESLSSDEDVFLVRTPIRGQPQQQGSDIIHLTPVSSGGEEHSGRTASEVEPVDSSITLCPADEYEATSSLDSKVQRRTRRTTNSHPTSTVSLYLPADEDNHHSSSTISMYSHADVVRREKKKRPRIATSVRTLKEGDGSRELWTLETGVQKEAEPIQKYRSMSNLVEPVTSGKSK